MIDITQLAPDVSNRVSFHLRKAMYVFQQLFVKSVVVVADAKTDPSVIAIFSDRGKESTFRFLSTHSVRDAELALDNEGKFLKV